MIQLLSILGILTSCGVLLRLLHCREIVDRILIFYQLLFCHLILAGHLLSGVDRLGDPRSWALCGILFGLLSLGVAASRAPWRRRIFARSSFQPGLAISRWAGGLSGFEKLLLTPLLGTTFLVSLASLALVLFCAPHNSDSMTYHLARMAYYLQQGNLDHLTANYWAQAMHPVNSTILFLYAFLVSGGNENMTQVVQFYSYLVAVVAVYGITLQTGQGKGAAAFAALCFALLIECLMQASTTQNDMIIAALTGNGVYFCFRWRDEGSAGAIPWIAIPLGLALGTKASFLLILPVVLLVAAFCLIRRPGLGVRERLSAGLRLLALVFAACLVLSLSAGYLENIQNYGHPLGTEKVRMRHTFVNQPVGKLAGSGLLNLTRFCFDAAALDTHIPFFPKAGGIQNRGRKKLGGLLKKAGLDLEQVRAWRTRFTFDKHPRAHEDRAYWGILGFALAWPLVLLALCGWIRSPELRMLAAASVLFLLLQAFSGPYDPWRGRYFISCAVFTLPILGACVRSRWIILKGYILLVVVLACATALFAVTFRTNRALVHWDRNNFRIVSVFSQDRLAQVTSNRKWCLEPLEKLERTVPEGARMAVALPERSYEYPLFGEGLNRTLIPINSFHEGLLPVPEGVHYLLYSSQVMPVEEGDRHLGRDWHLRRLE